MDRPIARKRSALSAGTRTVRRNAPSLLLVAAATLGTGAAALVSAGPTGASKPTTVTAIETDFHIALSKSKFTAGTYTFVIKNDSGTLHAFTITGPGLKNATVPTLNAGKTAHLTVTLKKGKYDIYCPVPDHKALGMNVNVTVTAAHAAVISSN